MTTTNNDNSHEKTVAELFLAAGLVTAKSPTLRTTTSSSSRWRTPYIIGALIAVAGVATALTLH